MDLRRPGAKVIRVADVGDQRWAVALDVLADGGTLIFDEVMIDLAGADSLLLRVPWANGSRRPTVREATKALDRAESCVDDLRADRRFNDLVRGRRIESELIDDYGTGAVLLAVRRAGKTSLI